MKKAILTVATLGLMISCVPFRDSPFSDTLLRGDRNLNFLYMQSVGDVEEDEIIRIAVIADSHGNYTDLDKVIGEVNATPGLDFVVHLGDFTNSSYNYEYDQFLAQYAEINRPHFMVLGNHDALGAGPSLFKKAFGPSNYFFESEHFRFIFWNSTNWESGDAFDPEWLKRTVADSQKAVLIFTHIPLEDEERFEGPLREGLLSARDNPHVAAVFNGHNHVYWLREGITPLVQVPRSEDGKWLLFEIKPDGLYLKPKPSATGETWLGFKPSLFQR